MNDTVKELAQLWKSDIDRARSDYDEISLIVMVKLKGRKLNQLDHEQLQDLVDFLDCLIAIAQFYPSEQKFICEFRNWVRLRMNANLVLENYAEAELDAMMILNILEEEKKSYTFYDDKYGGLGSFLGTDRQFEEEINKVKQTLDFIRLHKNK